MLVSHLCAQIDILMDQADRKIKLWSPAGEVLAQFKGSADAVRSLQVLPGGDAFVSASNDGYAEIMQALTSET